SPDIHFSVDRCDTSVRRAPAFGTIPTYEDGTEFQTPSVNQRLTEGICSQGRFAKSALDPAAELSHRRVPPMSAPGEAPRGGRGGSAAALSRPALLGAAAPRLRRSARSPLAGGAGAGGARRQSHGAHVHGGPER